MRKEADFIEIYKQKMRKYMEVVNQPPTERDWDRFELTKELARAQYSQFQRVKNEKRWNQLEHEFYPLLHNIAEMQGGRVELNIDEKIFVGELIYIGSELLLGNLFCTELKDFSAIAHAAENMSISIVDGKFKIYFLFCLYDKIQIADHTEQIAEVERKIQQYKMQHPLEDTE